MACVVLARAAGASILEWLPEPYWPRRSGTLGNPTYLGAYMLVSAGLAAGLAVRGWMQGAAPAAALGFAWFASGRRRSAALVVLAVLAVGVAGLGARFVDPDRGATVEIPRSPERWSARGAVAYAGSVHLHKPSVQSRLAAWEAGIEGLAERPLLGWGPGNFVIVFGRFASGFGAVAEVHDQAHGKLVEVAATTGAAGLLAWVALWGLVLAVLARATRGYGPARARVGTVRGGGARGAPRAAPGAVRHGHEHALRHAAARPRGPGS